MANTRQLIMEHGHFLLRNNGYAGLNYSAISEKLGIKNAAIHYHFKRKEDLVAAIIAKETELMAEREIVPPDLRLEEWFQSCIEECQTLFCVCLIGSLVGDYDRLPLKVQNTLKEYGSEFYLWMVRLLREGKAQGIFSFQNSADNMAIIVLSSIQGARQASRLSGVIVLQEVIQGLKELLGLK